MGLRVRLWPQKEPPAHTVCPGPPDQGAEGTHVSLITGSATPFEGFHSEGLPGLCNGHRMLVCWRVLVSVDRVALGPELLWPQGKCLPAEQPVKPIDDQTEAWKLWPSRNSDAFHTPDLLRPLALTKPMREQHTCNARKPQKPQKPSTPNPDPPQQHTCIAGHLTPSRTL